MSNQLEEIKKLYAKKKSYTIPTEPREGEEQVKLEITPLSLDDIGALNFKENQPMDEIANNAKTLFAKSLEIEESEASKISFAFMADLLEAIMDANNLKEEDMKKTGIKDFIAQKKAQLAEKEKDGKSTGQAQG